MASLSDKTLGETTEKITDATVSAEVFYILRGIRSWILRRGRVISKAYALCCVLSFLMI